MGMDNDKISQLNLYPRPLSKHLQEYLHLSYHLHYTASSVTPDNLCHTSFIPWAVTVWKCPKFWCWLGRLDPPMPLTSVWFQPLLDWLTPLLDWLTPLWSKGNWLGCDMGCKTCWSPDWNAPNLSLESTEGELATATASGCSTALNTLYLSLGSMEWSLEVLLWRPLGIPPSIIPLLWGPSWDGSVKLQPRPLV